MARYPFRTAVSAHGSEKTARYSPFCSSGMPLHSRARRLKVKKSSGSHWAVNALN